ncbi:MAG: hypothetical protein R6V23_16880 [Bacteroidales bacterium]
MISMFQKSKLFILSIAVIFLFVQCEDNDDLKPEPKDPDTASIVSVDRFSDDAATLMKRSENMALPGANEPVNFDQGDFITQSFGPDGQVVKYYNFDVQPLAPAPIYMLFKENSTDPVAGQLNIIDVIPGDAGYNDFWIAYKVTVPDDYQANTVTSYQEIINEGYNIEPTINLINCPIVPQGSTANLRHGSESKELDRGWYKGEIVYYFTFIEKDLETNQAGMVPLSPIYVTFNINPDDTNPDSGPPSGFVTETGTLQTHNVIATVPSDANYSPLWSVYVYDNADFDNVNDLASAQTANILAEGVMYVNCPVVYEE